MRLDRNVNSDRGGKYALLKLRNLKKFPNGQKKNQIKYAINVLDKAGLIHWGDEGSDEQFFVMKYKDKFAAPALKAYTKAVCDAMHALKSDDPQFMELFEYGADMMREAIVAEKLGTRIPD